MPTWRSCHSTQPIAADRERLRATRGAGRGRAVRLNGRSVEGGTGAGLESAELSRHGLQQRLGEPSPSPRLRRADPAGLRGAANRSEEPTTELQSLMRNSYAG